MERKKRLQKVNTLTPSVIVVFFLKINKIFFGFNCIMVFIITYFRDSQWMLWLKWYIFAILYLFESEIVEWSYFFFLLQKDIEGFG